MGMDDIKTDTGRTLDRVVQEVRFISGGDIDFVRTMYIAAHGAHLEKISQYIRNGLPVDKSYHINFPADQGGYITQPVLELKEDMAPYSLIYIQMLGFNEHVAACLKDVPEKNRFMEICRIGHAHDQHTEVYLNDRFPGKKLLLVTEIDVDKPFGKEALNAARGSNFCFVKYFFTEK